MDAGLTHADKRERTESPSVAPLSAFARRIRQETGQDVPWFDPDDGGVQARVLLLMEAPGRRARHSGFVSVDNPSPTSRHLRELREEAGLARRDCVLWNAVPWYVGEPGRIRAARAADVRAGLPYLRELLALLPELRVVVALGRPAGRAASGLPLPVLETWHPSGQNLFPRGTGPAKRAHILAMLREAVARAEARAPAGGVERPGRVVE